MTKLEHWNFHVPVMVGSRPVHGVSVGRDGVTAIELDDGCVRVLRGEPWFVATAFGTGVYAVEVVTVAEATQVLSDVASRLVGPGRKDRKRAVAILDKAINEETKT